MERTVIWTDLSLTRHPHLYNNVEGNQKGIVLMGKAMTTLRKPDLYDLFMLHAKVTRFDIEQIMEEYVV